MALAYATGICLLYVYRQKSLKKMFACMAAPGRMALTNYISQSIVGIMLFYGLGLGLGTTFGLVTIEVTAVLLFLFQIVASTLWLQYFSFGPFEWIWRMLTYGRYFKLKKQTGQ